MAVAFDAKSVADTTANGVTSVTATDLTIGSGSNRALAVMLAFSLKTISALAVTWDFGTSNQALTVCPSGAFNASDNARVEIWGVVNPLSGAKTLKAAWTGASDIYMESLAVTGASQTGGATTFGGGLGFTGSSTSCTGTITGTANDMSIAMSCNASLSITAQNQTALFADNVATGINSAASRATGGTATSFTFTIAVANQFVTVVMNIKAPAPFASISWPNPSFPRFPASLHSFNQPYDLLLLQNAGAKPFVNSDQPGPPKGRPFPIEGLTFLGPVKTQLIGKDKFFAAVGQGPSYDYPNPIGRPVPIDNRTWIVNLLQTTLSAVPVPFNMLDWPNPRWPVPSIELRTFLDPVDIQLIGQDKFFGVPGQPPTFTPPVNPWGRPFPVDARTHIGTLWPVLVGRDTFFGAPGQGPASPDWPVPPRARYVPPTTDWAINLLQSTLAITIVPFNQDDWPLPRVRVGSPIDWVMGIPAPIGTLTVFPFSETEWPNPAGKPQSPILRTHLDPARLTIAGQDQFYSDPGQGPVYDYPNPKGAARSIDLRTWTQSMSLLGRDTFFGGPGQPPANLDWPVPKAAPRNVSDRSVYDQTHIILIGQDKFFGAPGMGPRYDYPNPIRPVPVASSWLVNLLESTLSIPNPYPFSLMDWPVPQSRAYPVALRTFIDQLKLNLAGRDTFFAAPGMGPVYDHRNPTLRVPPAQSWLVNLLQSTLAATPAPFYQLSWPLPPGPIYPSHLRTFLDQTRIQLVGQDRMFGAPGQVPSFDWVVPRGPTYPIGLRTLINVPTPHLVRQDTFFAAPGMGPANLDWPNPRGPAYPLSLRTLIDPLKLQLLGQDRMFGAPGQVRTFDWQLPIRPPLSPALKSWSLGPCIQVWLPVFLLPFSLKDWPNPAYNIARRARSLITFINQYKADLLPFPIIVQFTNDGISTTEMTADELIATLMSVDALTSTDMASDAITITDADPDADSVTEMTDEDDQDSH